jgi:hypothetical protein
MRTEVRTSVIGDTRSAGSTGATLALGVASPSSRLAGEKQLRRIDAEALGDGDQGPSRQRPLRFDSLPLANVNAGSLGGGLLRVPPSQPQAADVLRHPPEHGFEQDLTPSRHGSIVTIRLKTATVENDRVAKPAKGRKTKMEGLSFA